MKRILIICLAITIFACKEEPKVDYALFSGKIENPKGEKVVVLKGRDVVKEITLNKDGTFTDTLKIESGYYNLSHGNERTGMHLSPGSDINITLDTKEFDETISYTGKGSENSSFLASKFLEDEKSNLDFAKVFSMEEADFLSKMNEIKNTKEEFLTKAEGISEDFKALEEKNIYFEHISYLQNYPGAHSYYTKKEDFKASDDFMKPLNALDYKNEADYNSIDTYKQLVLNHYSSLLSKSDNPAKILEDINANAFPALKTDFSKSLRYNLSPNNEHNEAYYNGIMAMSSDEKYKEDITTKYNKVKTLAKGMPSPEFIDYENHKGGTTSLEDLKGKYVYVDVWATWCGPCIAEIPSLQKVEKQYHGKNIAFVSTSIDKAKDHNTWVEMVKDKELGGMQLMADNDWKSKFVTDYAIEGIPRFLLIDPNGNIISADAPRPSSPKLIELFKELKI
ncbi:thioredoxin family protein [Flavobacteriales bacterium ALC-1]|nr:thioredoxin family protein [Flavobacteriales bacterium ALC-1]